MPFFPLARRSTAGRRDWPRAGKIVQVADKHRATPAQIALAWLLARYDRMLLIPGTSSVATSRRTWLRSRLELDDADLAALDRVATAPDAHAPARITIIR